MTRILIVDDNEQNRYMLQFLLEKQGYKVVVAADGREALEKARTDPPDLIVTDILMPVMDGFSLCRRWQADDQLEDIPFVFYTATYTDPEDRAFGLGLGAERFVVKPMEPDVFVEMLQEVFRDAEEGRLDAPQEPVKEERVFLKEYNERLIRKLEDKILQLDETNQALASEVAERKQAEHGLRRYARRLETLHEIDQAILAARSASETAEVALRHIQDLVPCAGAAIALFDDEAGGGVLIAVRAAADVDLERGTRISLENTLKLQDLQRGKIVAGKDLSPSSQPPAVLPVAGLRSYVAVPLIAAGELVGSLNMGFKTPNALSKEDEHVVCEVADQVAVALHQARLSADLAIERQRLQTTVEHLPAGILLLDGERHIVVANPAAQEFLPALTEASEGEVLRTLAGRPLEQLVASSPGGSWHELEVAGPPHRIFEVLARPLTHGRPQSEGWVVTVIDVTEERKAQERIRQQERLAAVGRLAGGIAHDFNNFLGTIMLYGNMILYDMDASPELNSAAETIVAECRRASDLVGQILDFSRRSPMEIESLDLVSFLDEIFGILRDSLPEDIDLRTEIGPRSCAVRADPTRVEQVMMNLAINARDAMAEGGELGIAVVQRTVAPGEDAPVAGMTPGEWVHLTVSDTGTGMTPEVEERVFEPFFTTKERRKGTGLGLAQVYGIVTQHGGFIDVETELGVGTTFHVYLPVHEGEETREVEEAPGIVEGGGEVILLVEDHEAFREAGRGTLEALGYRVLTATDGEDALEMLQEAAVDLVITDLVMPHLGGEALMQALKEVYPDLPVLALTAHGLRRRPEELREAGFVEVLLKPLDTTVLAEALRRALEDA